LNEKLLLSLIILVFTSVSILADTYVSGYYRSDGTYVKPHYRSSPDSYRNNNWSTSGNTNPYTGKQGTRTYGGTCTSLLNC
tara:strand:- start:531 stop:773 length:243 start_codon:yes stop_codon:yes gene_type:complete